MWHAWRWKNMRKGKSRLATKCVFENKYIKSKIKWHIVLSHWPVQISVQISTNVACIKEYLFPFVFSKKRGEEDSFFSSSFLGILGVGLGRRKSSPFSAFTHLVFWSPTLDFCINIYPYVFSLLLHLLFYFWDPHGLHDVKKGGASKCVGKPSAC